MCTLILGQQSEGVGGWHGGKGREGWEVAQKFFNKLFRVGKPTKSSQKGPVSHHKAKETSS